MSYAFYRWFPGDYQRDTMHLGWYEDLAYRRLIDLYNTTGRPIRNDRDYILRAVRASEPEQQAAVDVVLGDFFVLKPDGWHQLRCDAEIRHRTRKNADKQRAANVRWERHRQKLCIDAQGVMASAVQSELPINYNDLHAYALQVQCEPEPEPEPEEVQEGRVGLSLKDKSEDADASFALPDWIPIKPWKAWIAARRKKGKEPTRWAMEFAVTKLKNMRDEGHEPAQVLMQSAFLGYPDFYPVKERK